VVADHHRVRSGLAAAVLALAVVFGVVACSSGTSAPGGDAGYALEVNDARLSSRDFLDELGQIAGNQRYVDVRTSDNGGQPYTVFKPGTADPDPNVAAELLNERVSFELVADELKTRNLTITDADRDQAVSLIGQSLQRSQARAAVTSTTTAAGTAPAGATVPGATGTTLAGGGDAAVLGRQILDGFAGSYKQVLLDGVAGTLVLQRALADPNDDQTKQAFEQQKDLRCVSHILALAGTNAGQTDPQTSLLVVPSDADYQSALVKITQLRAQLVGGADFATVAKASSEDTGSKASGGDLGCAPKGTYDKSFDDAVWAAPIGQMTEPIKSSFGYHLIVVRETQTVTYDDFVQKAQGQALQQFLQQAAQSAKVVVAPSLGTWDAQSGTVQAAAATGLTLSPLDTDQPDLGLGTIPANPLAPLEPGTTR
jgi:peptidyl-prolyl cis-trans isomerase C